MEKTEKFSFLFIMDPYSTLNYETETSLLLMSELRLRGDEVFWIERDQIHLKKNRLWGRCQRVLEVKPFQLGKKYELLLDNFDVVLNRIDPPFDLNYLHLTYLLDFLDEKVVQFNPAGSLREANEKLFSMRWPKFIPETITTMNPFVLRDFVEQHGKIIVKPLNECSGRGIQVLEKGEENLESLLHSLMRDEQGKARFITAQVFLEAVSGGDKRVYLVDGKAMGMVNRVPAQGSFLGNIHQGARCEATQLTEKEEIIIQKISPILQEKGLFLVGLDFINEKMTEMNLTSPSAIRQINAVTGERVEKKIVTAMLNYIQKHQQGRQKSCCSEHSGMIRSNFRNMFKKTA